MTNASEPDKPARPPQPWLWLKRHHDVLKWLPFGQALWRLADDKVEAWHAERMEEHVCSPDEPH